jgi:hypothetical protein
MSITDEERAIGLISREIIEVTSGGCTIVEKWDTTNPRCPHQLGPAVPPQFTEYWKGQDRVGEADKACAGGEMTRPSVGEDG